ncbi:nucleotidyltransferase family protein [Vulcanisaeta distributa]|uniref:DNA polymerase beta domain protein region n=1 Tax=Vulcanisaeta distributa (strain DSM 14429 / JCM 11212 / NBRC 100878 / IC-017) TaxID=572478 RepID=E1QPI4_VULDI|nr:nucleotidyltransferase domain-containing protein [Vulcanisaeta distributa]ADN51472.1 DNA polymerase beta domain protein region [Vulcanisaeta distributa DSM 14429]
MFRKGLDFIKEPYRTVIQNLLNSLIRLYGDNLVSLVIYGSVARGVQRRDSDIDMLVIFEELPKPMSDRIKMFERAEDEVQSLLDELLDRGYAITLSPLIKTREEAKRFSPLYLDMTEDAVIVYDKDGFFEGVLTRIINRLRELGATRVWVSDRAWYWVLKRDYRFGEVIEIE